MSSYLSARSILVTGCASGIGYEVAWGLQRRGYRVFATARKSSDVIRLQQEGLESLQLDLADSESLRQAVQTVLECTQGKLYGLFNNGAYGQPGAVEDLSREALRQQLETNVLGTHELTCLVIPSMRRQGEGRIIQNSSLLGLVALRYRGAYTASKFALEGLTDTLRLELVGSGIQVSLIEPGPIVSRFRANSYVKFKQYVEVERSIHREVYGRLEARLLKPGTVAPFTLSPAAVLKRVVHALESPRPQLRYYVTWPTYGLATLKRWLPYRVMDWVLRQIE